MKREVIELPAKDSGKSKTDIESCGSLPIAGSQPVWRHSKIATRHRRSTIQIKSFLIRIGS